ncbi:hypothetical protein [Aeromicrobium sp. 179-A 4D2 NHS]|uniref:hypothetical protein n=1 Tax=Aeromicrobium sp. 179-A 4D2 NHS TaxID=3142375 RepID=UPI0039A1F371
MTDLPPPSPFGTIPSSPEPPAAPVREPESKRSRFRPVGNFLWAAAVLAVGVGAGLGGTMYFAPKDEPAPVVEPEIRTVIESPKECLGLGLALVQIQNSVTDLGAVVDDYSALIRPTFKAGQSNDKARGAQILKEQATLDAAKKAAVADAASADVDACITAIGKTQPKPDTDVTPAP